LYDDPGDAAAGVAKLVGDVGTVDGKPVAHLGHTFELVVGCHTVTNVTEWGGFDPSQAVMAKLPPISFAIDMRAGRTYVLRIAMVGDRDLAVEAYEQDANGEVTQRFEQGKSCS
jgi:hypothetical protein